MFLRPITVGVSTADDNPPSGLVDVLRGLPFATMPSFAELGSTLPWLDRRFGWLNPRFYHMSIHHWSKLRALLNIWQWALIGIPVFIIAQWCGFKCANYWIRLNDCEQFASCKNCSNGIGKQDTLFPLDRRCSVFFFFCDPIIQYLMHHLSVQVSDVHAFNWGGQLALTLNSMPLLKAGLCPLLTAAVVDSFATHGIRTGELELVFSWCSMGFYLSVRGRPNLKMVSMQRQLHFIELLCLQVRRQKSRQPNFVSS